MFYFSYVGNKRTEFKYIKEYITNLKDINIICEPFCGSCSVSNESYKLNKNITYHINDIDKTLINYLKDIKEEGSEKYFIMLNERLKDLTQEKYKEYIKQYKDDPTNLINYFFYNKCYGYRRGLYPERDRDKQKDYKKYISLDNFFKDKKTIITQGDYKQVMEQYKHNKNAFLFLDPPYLDSFNSNYATYDTKNTNNNNNTEKQIIIIDNTEMYSYIAEYLKNCECKVLLIINSNALNKYLYKDFILKEYEKLYSYTIKAKTSGQNYKKKTTHLIIGKL